MVAKKEKLKLKNMPAEDPSPPAPSLSIPEFSGYKSIAGLDMGEEVELVVTGKVVSLSKDEYGEHMRIDIDEIEALEADDEDEADA